MPRPPAATRAGRDHPPPQPLARHTDRKKPSARHTDREAVHPAHTPSATSRFSARSGAYRYSTTSAPAPTRP
ncbi:hypothetical protein, partial [Streptomyces europaeiscabiei]|uniref:hypothetical protein n=1 Tax=Streptomyces europaeiscabiei TaxID=146819 RepID=UPI0029B5C5F2